MKKSTSILIWIFAFIFTIGIAVYQRMTGPTYPVRGKTEIGGKQIKYRLIRSWEKPGDAEVRLEVPGNVEGTIRFKRFHTDDQWTEQQMAREDNDLVGLLPHQPPAGKIEYQVSLKDNGQSVTLNETPTVVRFTGTVPKYILIPHILLMFIAMMMSTRTGLEAIFKGTKTYSYALVTVTTLFLGGLILGPIVQKYAFGQLWTGWPFGGDLTDNKTLIAFIFWLIASIRLYKKRDDRVWAIVAMVVLLMVYLIPHSMFGSELNYKSGNITTGK